MPTELTLPQHLEGMRAALVAFVRYADRAGLRAPVPTTPDWTVRQLVAHQGMVHRWATAILRGGKGDPDAYEREGQSTTDPMEWLRDGAIDLAQAVTAAPDDLDVLVFLHDAPPAKRFWARRQCHETTMHAVDALSAALGRYPKGADTWISEEIALDGIDELLTGFVTRSKSRLRSEDPLTIGVCPTASDAIASYPMASHTIASDRAWVVRVSTEPAVTTVVAPDDPRCTGADVRLEGDPVALYLTLWNRSDEISAESDVLDLWRHSPITW
jgi:uncharacterized protein (TIGR03083 family)